MESDAHFVKRMYKQTDNGNSTAYLDPADLERLLDLAWRYVELQDD